LEVVVDRGRVERVAPRVGQAEPEEHPRASADRPQEGRLLRARAGPGRPPAAASSR
jgi:hypothetical protein